MHRIPIVLIGLLLMLPLVLSPAPITVAQSNPASQMETLVNQERGVNRVPTLAIHPALERAAANHNAQMDGAQTLCHTCLADGSVSDQEIAAGYQPNPTAWGQTAGINYPTAQEQMAGWIASPGHHATLINPIYQHLGCNYSATAWADLWTCDLAAGGALAFSGSPASDLETAVNQARVSNGVGALRIDSRLETSAQGKLNYMIASGCYLQRCTNELNVTERASAAGYPAGGVLAELIDSRDTTAEAVVAFWQQDGANSFLLLHPSFVALGCAASPPLWVCDLGQQAAGSGATSTAIPTATGTPTSRPSTATAVPATATSAPSATSTLTSTPLPTVTNVPPTATLTPLTEVLGECFVGWRAPGQEWRRYGDRLTRRDCLGF